MTQITCFACLFPDILHYKPTPRAKIVTLCQHRRHRPPPSKTDLHRRFTDFDQRRTPTYIGGSQTSTGDGLSCCFQSAGLVDPSHSLALAPEASARRFASYLGFARASMRAREALALMRRPNQENEREERLSLKSHSLGESMDLSSGGSPGCSLSYPLVRFWVVHTQSL